MTDPWKHRSESMKCKTCMWFCPKKQTINQVATMTDKDYSTLEEGEIHAVPDIEVVNLGRCRRRCPTMNGYPVVFVNDWCGDHKLNENTVEARP